MLPVFAFEQCVRIVNRARLPLFVARRLRQARFAGSLDLLFGGDNLHGAVRVVLVFLRGARAAAPFHQLIKRFKRLVVGDAAICSNVFHVRRAAAIQRRKHRLKMRAHLAWLHAAHARIAAKQDGRDAELRTPFLEADVRAGHTQHEFGDAHAERTRGQVVTAFVNDHQNAQHDGAIQNHQDNVHRQSSFCLKRKRRAPQARRRAISIRPIIKRGSAPLPKRNQNYTRNVANAMMKARKEKRLATFTQHKPEPIALQIRNENRDKGTVPLSHSANVPTCGRFRAPRRPALAAVQGFRRAARLRVRARP